MLSLYQNDVVHLLGTYDVEPARRVDVLFDHVLTVPTAVQTPDGVTDIEAVPRGSYRIDEDAEVRLRRFCETVVPTLRKASENSQRSRRLRRIAEHFLTAGRHAHEEGEVVSEYNADSTLHYVIALEAVLAGEDTGTGELTRKVTQRAAVIAGTDDADRLRGEKPGPRCIPGTFEVRTRK